MLPRLLLLAVILKVVTAEYCRFEISKRHAKYARCHYGCCPGECCEPPEEEEEKSQGVLLGGSISGGAVVLIILYAVIACLCRYFTGGGAAEIDL